MFEGQFTRVSYNKYNMGVSSAGDLGNRPSFSSVYNSRYTSVSEV